MNSIIRSYSPWVTIALGRLSPSALLTTIASATSMMPFLMPCRSSPAPVSTTSIKKSTIERTVISDWPTPTVSTKITSQPAASQSSMVSRLLRATPPKVPFAGDGRIKQLGSRESICIRVLSPKIEPPVIELVGSTARTATL